ncbi:protein spinster homolog 3 isoform X3 [Phodopus roborovskii]|uniref:protein spinster homolog 3 isoform X3 n=1 Tax=Phodopus roborovskii TaxID=109678 RepID=UPI0021E49581|nr:protein spinster homolog 3 isoform X3 [Phodopus roborovskii]
MQLCSAPILTQKLQLARLGMATECTDPWIGGPQSQALSPDGQYGALASGRCVPSSTSASWSLPRWRAYLAAAVLCYINLLNYMNWFIIPGVLLDVQKYFHISDSHAGLLQTVFIGCLLVSAPAFGYLGDRHSRKATLSFGILLWSGAGLASSFISYQYSWLFFLSRGVVGTGAASYSTIAPTVLGDLFVKDQRTCVLAVFYIFIPVGSGLGYVLGSVVAELTGSWRWALRIMPCLDALALVLLILLVPDIPRGAAEKQEEVAVGAPRSSWCEDVRYLGRNLIFGALTVATGIIGVILGAEASRRYKKVNPRAEPLICASSLFATAPCLFLALILASRTLLASYVFLALGELLLSCNWAVVADILLSVVVPRCRGTAEALQITVAHILGDAGSPYLTGLISSVLQSGRPNSYLQRFLSLQHSFLCCAFAVVLGGGCFLLTALHLERDQAQARQSGKGTLGSKDVAGRNMESQGLLSSTSTAVERIPEPILQ